MIETKVLLIGPVIHGLKVYDQVYQELERFNPHAVTIEGEPERLNEFRPLYFSAVNGKQLFEKLLEKNPVLHLGGVPWELAAAVTYARDKGIPCYGVDDHIKFDEKMVLGSPTTKFNGDRLLRVKHLVQSALRSMQKIVFYGGIAREEVREDARATSKEGMDARNKFMARMIEKVAEKHAQPEGTRIAHVGGAGHFRGEELWKRRGNSCIQDYLGIKSEEKILTKKD